MMLDMSDRYIKWLAGFFEGDSKIGIKDSKLAITFNDGENSRIHEYIKDLLGYGELGEDGDYLKLVGSDCTSFLALVSKYLVSPKKTELLNRYDHITNLPVFAMHVPTLDWLVGLWDADGNSKKDITISISKADYHLLWVIQQTWGGYLFPQYPGNIPRWSLAPTKENRSRCLEIASYIVENSKNEGKRLKLQERVVEFKVVEELCDAKGCNT